MTPRSPSATAKRWIVPACMWATVAGAGVCAAWLHDFHPRLAGFEAFAVCVSLLVGMSAVFATIWAADPP